MAMASLVLLIATFNAANLRAFLFGVEPRDFPTLAGACTVLAFAATLAAYVPARRAARVDPMTALRYE
jgi:ABC-type lipoprotein release transport system permease subunit